MRFTTTRPARTWDWPRTHRDDALSNDAEGSSPRQFCLDCITITLGYDFREGQEFPDLPRVGRLIQRLEAAGIDLASVTDVVLTHLHMDHCGGLLLDGVWERLRPDLRVHLAAAEAKFWQAPDFSRVCMRPGFPDA